MNSSTQSQPTPSVPSIDQLAPPLPPKSDAPLQPTSAAPMYVEPWVPVQPEPQQQSQTVSQLESATATVSSTVESWNPSQGNGSEDANRATSVSLLDRILQQRNVNASLQGKAYKDNTLVVFVVLCMVLVAIACSIYFVADREAQVKDKSQIVTALPKGFVPYHVGSAKTTQPEPQGAASNNMFAGANPNPLFGKPVRQAEKAVQLTEQSTNQLSRMEYIEAEYSARQAIAIAPSSGETWLALGRALYAEGRYQEAQDAFSKCLKCKPTGEASNAARNFMAVIPSGMN